MSAGEHEQGALIESVVATARTARTKSPAGPAATLPVARVMVDSPLPHLDRPFDYSITADQDETVQAGVRVRVRFAGTDVAGIVLDRVDESDHVGRLTPLARVVSPVPVLTPETMALVRAVADRYAGTFTDVLRAAVPPRHARVESEPGSVSDGRISQPGSVSDGRISQPGSVSDGRISQPGSVSDGPPPSVPEAEVVEGGWSRYAGGEALLGRLRSDAQALRAVWTALPGEDVPTRIAEMCGAVVQAGRGALVVVPDARDVARFARTLEESMGIERVVRLTADLGPAPRYRAFLRVLRGSANVVIGTRAAAFAPVSDLGLVVIWDDGDDLHSDPHAPYWHAREVLALRSSQTGCAMVMAGHARSVEAAQAVSRGWAREVVPSRQSVRANAPRVAGTDDDDVARDEAARVARVPHRAFMAAREALATGPVLVQVPRRGYVPALACQRCRAAARCPACAGPLAASSGHAVAACRWCGRLCGDYTCPECAGRTLRAITVGAGRTAEELGRAFPAIPVITSGRDGVVDSVGAQPALVVCTPGAEPVADGGYAAALLLDGRLLAGRADLRASEEALRRWMNAAALVRPASEGGLVVVVADAGLIPVQALVRWDPAGMAERERAERQSLRLPPAWRVAEVSGSDADVRDFLAHLDLPPDGRVLGPVGTAAGRRDQPDRVRALISAPPEQGSRLAGACKAAACVRSAAKSGGPVTLRLDPIALG